MNEQEFSYKPVTPEQAQAWLDHPDPRQRRPGSSHGNGKVSQYADMMLAGDWDPEVPQGVFLTPAGPCNERCAVQSPEPIPHLLNGGNRLTAVVKAGVAITLFIVRNVPERIFDVIDIGKARFPGQFLPGIAHASVARWLMWYEQRFDQKPSGSAMSFPLREVITYGEDHAHADEIGQAVAEATAVHKGSHIPVAIHAAVLVLARRDDDDFIANEITTIDDFIANEITTIDWLTGLRTGANLGEDDPRLALRNRYAHRAKLGRNAGQVAGDWTAIVVAFNAFNAGTPLGRAVGSGPGRSLIWPRVGETASAWALRQKRADGARTAAAIRGDAARRGRKNAKERERRARHRSTLAADAAVVQELAMVAGGVIGGAESMT